MDLQRDASYPFCQESFLDLPYGLKSLYQPLCCWEPGDCSPLPWRETQLPGVSGGRTRALWSSSQGSHYLRTPSNWGLPGCPGRHLRLLQSSQASTVLKRANQRKPEKIHTMDKSKWAQNPLTSIKLWHPPINLFLIITKTLSQKSQLQQQHGFQVFPQKARALCFLLNQSGFPHVTGNPVRSSVWP